MSIPSSAQATDKNAAREYLYRECNRRVDMNSVFTSDSQLAAPGSETATLVAATDRETHGNTVPLTGDLANFPGYLSQEGHNLRSDEFIVASGLRGNASQGRMTRIEMSGDQKSNSKKLGSGHKKHLKEALLTEAADTAREVILENGHSTRTTKLKDLCGLKVPEQR